MTFNFPHNDNALGWWLRHAARDYGAARCCLVHGLFSGFILAQQSIEKLLKAYLRIAVPGGVRPKGVLPNVHRSHDLIAHAREVDARFPSLGLESNFTPLLTRLSQHFQGKYPDSGVGHLNASSAEVHELDTIAVLLFTSLPLPVDLKVRTGIYPDLWHLVSDQAKPPEAQWLPVGNAALNVKLADILTEIRAGL